MQPVEQHVARLRVGRVAVARAVLEQDVAGQAELGAGRRGLARVVGLGRALRHHDVGALPDRLGHQVFELARLVAARAETGAVVALDPQLRPREPGGKALHRLERGGPVAEADTGEAGEVHVGVPSGVRGVRAVRG